ncbi:ATP-grasp fold amidoligase family protein [Puniceibacterium sediminis]|uniref:TupA-like ATPgrasp n=1 Tax=Puniceibacterium sediminis TaxID=1608407 RepID=A0A238VFF4_9RHOB|nr:ATP-grasp fold amidoligase family protein [Puniceibacterium sediminis]SNR33122.1 TupA-like ATPgrasp [Puniceibacterium sediminis]
MFPDELRKFVLRRWGGRSGLQDRLASASSPHPELRHLAQSLLQDGRIRFNNGSRAEGMACVSAAVKLDPSVICEPWDLLPLLEAEGRSNFRERLDARLRAWYHLPDRRVHAAVSLLSKKPEMRAWIGDLGLPLPKLYAGPVALGALDWGSLPPDVVIKPVNGANSDGLVVSKGGIDVMRGQPALPDLQEYVSQLYSKIFKSPPQVLVEELLVDVHAEKDQTLQIPRDFKVFTVAGHAGFTRVFDRNDPSGKRSLASYDRDGRRLPPSREGWREAPKGVVLPEGYSDLIKMAELISQKLPWLLRLDFYLTDRGPVFGEFTTYPGAGRGLTPFSDRTLLQMWELWPD